MYSSAPTTLSTTRTGSINLTSAQTFKVLPTVASFSPTSGPVGTSVSINGTGLMQTTKVAFNGTPASSAINSDILITATVPAAATTGKIKVVTKGGNATTVRVSRLTSGERRLDGAGLKTAKEFAWIQDVRQVLFCS